MNGRSSAPPTFTKKEDYIQSHSFRFGLTLCSVGYLPSPQWPALGWGGMSGIVPLQFVWSDEGNAQNFADAFNRLLYAAYGNEDSAELQAFSAAAHAWRENPVKPPLSPEADRARILAENALKEKNLDSAVEHYESGLEVQPMWPAGWFNLALIYAEQNNYADATDRMKHYLELAPDAPDAKDAREQMIIWEDKAKH
jgi:tetratricopeptide (TPR) repeat protein